MRKRIVWYKIQRIHNISYIMLRQGSCLLHFHMWSYRIIYNSNNIVRPCLARVRRLGVTSFGSERRRVIVNSPVWPRVTAPSSNNTVPSSTLEWLPAAAFLPPLNSVCIWLFSCWLLQSGEIRGCSGPWRNQVWLLSRAIWSASDLAFVCIGIVRPSESLNIFETH